MHEITLLQGLSLAALVFFLGAVLLFRFLIIYDLSR